MKFLHLSDTHLRRDYQTNDFTSKLADQKINPTEHLQEAMASWQEEAFDFALITGDLVHEGEQEDYELFKKLWQDNLPEVPYFFCRGNHDRLQPFLQAMAADSSQKERYLTCQEFKGVRIICLDSAQEQHHEGKISSQQLQQLTDWLSEPAEKGTLLLLHHPLAWEEAAIQTETPDGFEQVIADSDIKGIFVGHIHQGTTACYAGKMQYMTEAMSFGVDEFPNESIFTDRTGYNVCSLTAEGLFVAHHYLTPKQTVIGGVKKPVEGNF